MDTDWPQSAYFCFRVWLLARWSALTLLSHWAYIILVGPTCIWLFGLFDSNSWLLTPTELYFWLHKLILETPICDTAVDLHNYKAYGTRWIIMPSASITVWQRIFIIFEMGVGVIHSTAHAAQPLYIIYRRIPLSNCTLLLLTDLLAPKAETVDNFWKMIWHEKINRIVALVLLYEGARVGWCMNLDS